MAVCPNCGWPRPAAGPIQVAWTADLKVVPAGPPLRLGDHLLLPTHDRGRPPRQAALYRLSLAGTPQDRVQVFESALISGIRPARYAARKPDRAEVELILMATYSSEPIASTSALLALDTTGQEVWHWSPGVQAISAPTLGGETVWVTTNTRFLVGLDLASGAERTRIALGLTPSLAAPLVRDEVAYIPTYGPRLLAIGLDGQLRWRFDLASGWLDQTPVIHNDRLYTVANLAGLIVALARTTGRIAWQVELGPRIGKRLSPATTDGERLYVGARDGLYAFALNDGWQLWHFPTERRIEAASVVAGGVVYAAGRDHHLYALDAGTGLELWRYQATAPLEVAPLLLSGDSSLVIVADRKGQVTALRRPLSPAEQEAAGRWSEVTKKYAAELWNQLDHPLQRAVALVQKAWSLGQAGAEPEVEAKIWTAAAKLFEKEGEWEHAKICRREVARCREWPLFEISVQAVEGLTLQTWSRLKFTLRNQGYGPAKSLIIRVTNKEMFAGTLAETREIALLRPDKVHQRQLNVKPLEVGQVPLQINLSYQDSQGQTYTHVYPVIYLPVARSESERQPSEVYHIHTGGAYIQGDVNTGGGEFVGRDQTGSPEHG
jgi:outer membrane protein assembly factor BamB